MTKNTFFKSHKGALATVVIVSSLALVGCQSKMETLEAVPSSSPADSFPIKVTQSDVSYHVNTRIAARGLNNNIRHDVANLARGYMQEGTGSLTVGVPRSGGSHARNAAAHVKKGLIHYGVPASNIKTKMIAGMGAASPLKVSYPRLVAMSVPCGMENTDLVATFENKSYKNLGCATQRNLAAMIADPSKLVAPDPLGPIPATRRVGQFDAFNKGEEIELEPSSETVTTGTN